MKIRQFKQTLKFSLLHFYGSYISGFNKMPKFDRVISCNQKQVKFFANTPNTIIYFKTEECEGYFRECRIHRDEFSFIEELVKDYCTYIVEGHNRDVLYSEIVDYMKNKNGYKAFFNMGDGTNPYSPINEFRRKHNPAFIGFDENISQLLRDNLLSLVQFAWGPLAEYQYCSNQKNGLPHLFNSTKTIVTKIVADAIGAESIIPDTYYAKMILDGKERVGVVVGVAEGVVPKKGNNYAISGILQRDLMSLNILDTIVYQKDHRPGNYFVKLNSEKEMIGVSAFDNDAPSTMQPVLNPKMRTYLGCTPLVSDHSYNRPYVPKRVYKKIKGLSTRRLRGLVLPFCSKVEALALCIRYKRLRQSLIKAVDEGSTKCLSDEQWDINSISQEIKTKSVYSYLHLLIDKYN